MDKILNYAVHKPNGKEIDRKTGVAIRLVNKNWLQSASRTLKKLNGSMISITVGLDKGKCMLNMKKYDTKAGSLLEKFILIFSKNSKRSIDSILPLSLDLEQHIFYKEKSILRNFFEQCGDIIQELGVTYPLDDEGSLNLKWNDIKFPNLHVLQFNLNIATPCHNSKSQARGIIFLHHILQNSENLKHFELENRFHQDFDISSLSLPAKVESFLILGTLTTQYLTILQNNKLPNLKTLDLEICAQEEEDVMFKILKHLGRQLRNFSLRKWDADSTICVRFPLMEKLNCLKISGDGFYLPPQLKQGWSKLVPNLTCLMLDNLVQPHFVDLVRGSPFENVKKLKLSPESMECFTNNNAFSADKQAFNEILVSFPNIQKLSLHFEIDELFRLKYLFQNFTHLKNLRLLVDTFRLGRSVDYRMVSLFLGITPELAEAIFDATQENVSVPVQNPMSIMNLKGNEKFLIIFIARVLF